MQQMAGVLIHQLKFSSKISLLIYQCSVQRPFAQ